MRGKGGTVTVDLCAQVRRDTEAFVGLPTPFVLLKETFSMVLNAALARHYTVCGRRTFDLG